MGRLITGAGFTGTIGGNVTVYGTAERQTITVADVAGTVTFDPSFNKGGDTIVFPNSATLYSIAQSGSTVIIADNDSRVVIPVGTIGVTLQFYNGDFKLVYSDGQIKLGSQSISSSSKPIAGDGNWNQNRQPLAADASSQPATLVLNNEEVWVGGNVKIFGTSLREAVNLTTASGRVVFDASFNKGNDRITVWDPAANYVATRSGSSIVMTAGAREYVIPVGVSGLPIQFADGDRSVIYADGEFKMGAQAIAGSNTPLSNPSPLTDLKILQGDLSVRINGTDYFQKGSYIVYPQNWGTTIAGLKAGVDFTASVYYHSETFPKNTLNVWEYPSTPFGNGSTVYGYPLIAFGTSTLALTGYQLYGTITQVKNIIKFVERFDVTLTGDKHYQNLMSDLFFYNSDGKIAAEITFNVKPDNHILYWGDPQNYFGSRPGAHSHEFTMGDTKYNMLVSSYADGEANLNLMPGARMILIIPTDGKSTTSATLDWGAVIKTLLDHGDISGDWYIKGVELGVEVQAGSGTMLVNDFHVELTYLNPATGSYVTMG